MNNALTAPGISGRSAIPETSPRGLTILLVEDDDDDRLFVRRAVSSSGVAARVESVSSADEAEDYLMGRNRFADRHQFPFPDLVLCDLVMPLRTGLDFLCWLKRQSPFRQIAAMAISGTGGPDQQEHLRSLGLGEIVDKTSMVLNPSVLTQAIDRLLGLKKS
jgi:CheY-like chemotaxis protein